MNECLSLIKRKKNQEIFEFVQDITSLIYWLINFKITGKLVERTMMKKYGVENINDHLMSFNTLCYATHVNRSFFVYISKFCNYFRY